MTILAIRRPVIPEDEGRYHIAGQFLSQASADAWVSGQIDEYFKPSDYFLVEVPQ